MRSTSSAPCRAIPPALDGAKAAAALALYDRNVSVDIEELARAVPAASTAGLSARRVADVLDVFTATWERAEDHPKLSHGALSLNAAQMAELHGGPHSNTSLEDCTHYCIPGSVLRFWSQALLAWLVKSR